MEIVTIILLAVIIVFFIWDRFRQEQRWREQSDRLSETVGERIADTTRVFGEVQKSLGELSKGTQQIEEVGKNISSLQEILRAPKFRGGFGELLLERLLADVLPNKNYETQHRFLNGDTVDAVIEIGDKLVPIDSKFPLEDFQRMLAAESEKEQESLRRQFIRTIKKHIDNVTKYILPDEGTFDFALMYIPAENVYYETILRGHEEEDIYSYSIQKRVIPVSPNSFYAYLQVIIQGLQGLHIEKFAQDIRGNLERLKVEFDNFQQDYATLGGHIRNAANKYDEANRKLDRFGDKLQLTGETPPEKLPQGNGGKSDDGSNQ